MYVPVCERPMARGSELALCPSDKGVINSLADLYAHCLELNFLLHIQLSEDECRWSEKETLPEGDLPIYLQWLSSSASLKQVSKVKKKKQSFIHPRSENDNTNAQTHILTCTPTCIHEFGGL